ncbi:hypothetical protein IWZ03DRAFT_64884 [Phyllosticta citriasiana]|uniref:Uncharacterized protein n=1 Tax=Phyllosticta citriasiana TaxID=595635 RepID=A0ABR1KBQ5_9PEZI
MKAAPTPLICCLSTWQEQPRDKVMNGTEVRRRDGSGAVGNGCLDVSKSMWSAVKSDICTVADYRLFLSSASRLLSLSPLVLSVLFLLFCCMRRCRIPTAGWHFESRQPGSAQSHKHSARANPSSHPSFSHVARPAGCARRPTLVRAIERFHVRRGWSRIPAPREWGLERC